MNDSNPSHQPSSDSISERKENSQEGLFEFTGKTDSEDTHATGEMSGETHSDAETIAPADNPAEKSQKSTGVPLAIAGSVGCVLLLCLALLVGSGLLLFPLTRSAASDEPNVAANEPAVSTVVAVPSVAPPDADVKETSPTPQKKSASSDTLNVTSDTDNNTDNASVTDVPEIGPITFALKSAVKDGASESAFSFEPGVTQIYATFEYAHLAPGSIWTQVWYHNGSEVLSNSQPWLEEERGVFDYIIEAGGDPLPAGQWALEFYIGDELLSAGSFVIEGGEELPESDTELTLDDISRTYPLVYTKWNGEKHDLFVGDTSGSFERYIMGRAAGPSWSPDGRYIFFYGEEGVDQQVVDGNVIPLPGVSNGVARITAAPLPANVSQLQLFQGYGWNDGSARGANMSPDGSMIAYDGDRGGGRRIYFLGTDTNQQFRYEIIGEQADWSPDGQKIVYRSGRNNQVGIWISNRDDSGHVRITDGGTDSFPTWSPDGKTIAFSRDTGGNVDIYTVDVDGTNMQRLTSTPGHDTLPAYLPNGDLVFRSARTGSWDIWKMKGDGSDQTQIISNAPVGPDWAFSKMDVLP